MLLISTRAPAVPAAPGPALPVASPAGLERAQRGAGASFPNLSRRSHLLSRVRRPPRGQRLGVGATKLLTDFTAVSPRGRRVGLGWATAGAAGRHRPRGDQRQPRRAGGPGGCPLPRTSPPASPAGNQSQEGREALRAPETAAADPAAGATMLQAENRAACQENKSPRRFLGSPYPASAVTPTWL